MTTADPRSRRAHRRAVPMILLAAAAAASAQPQSRFDTTSEGWTFYNDGTGPAWSGTVGNPPGSFLVNDNAQGTYWGFLAPAPFRGDQSGAYGRFFTFEVRPSHVDTSGNAQPDAAIIGGGLTLVIDLANPIANQWSEYEVAIAAGAGWRVSTLTGTPATEVQIRQALAAITALRIRGEFSTARDTAYLDNVSFGGAPCYANCDRTVGPVLLDIFDFLCFQNFFDQGDPYACDCDTGSGPGICDIFDFLCFQNAYDAGCP